MKKEKVEKEEALVPVPEENEFTPMMEKTEERNAEKQPRPAPDWTLRRVLRAILWLVVTVVLVGGCGAAVYFGAPRAYRQYVRPVEENTSQLYDLNIRQSQNEIQIAELQMRLSTLEAGKSNQGESITDLDARLQSLEGADVKRSESLTELTYQSDLLRAMELLSRARLFLYQSNFGLARSDVQAARDVLAELRSVAPESKQKDLAEAIFRLDLALKNLPDFPVAASDDLDIAWQVLLDGYPVVPTATLTPLPTATPEAASTPLPDLTPTPTATP